jgi:hypothetical protein
MIDRKSLRLSAALMLGGQLLFIGITLFHADGPANNHPVVFAEYAASGTWKAVHLGQFVAMAILLAGLFALPFALDVLLMALSGLTYLVQGLVVGAQGFSGAETIAIEVAYVLDLVWMIWLVVIARRAASSLEPRASG